MKHIKKYYNLKLDTSYGELIVEGPINPDDLKKYTLDKDLNTFRAATKQLQALIEIAESPEGRIIIARYKKNIVGYVTFHYTDTFERWSEANLDTLLELGAIEVIPIFRRWKVAHNLLKVALLDNYMENYIVIATNYYWHWDLDRTGLNIWDYRKVMEKVMLAGGLKYMATDDEEICSYPANCLTVRIGKNVSKKNIEVFDKIRIKNQF